MVGEVNYETGAISWTLPERPNAEFVISVLHTNPFSGKLDATQNSRRNSLRQILGNTPQQKCEAILTVTTFQEVDMPYHYGSKKKKMKKGKKKVRKMRRKKK